MKRIYFVAITTWVALGEVFPKMPQAHSEPLTQIKEPGNTTFPLRITISSFPDETYSGKNFPVRVTFENVSKKDLRLLRVFEPRDVFFHFQIKKPDGSYIPTPRSGKADFRAQDFQYINLKSDETFGVKVNLSEILQNPFDSTQYLPAGQYEVSATYTNQYGDDCFDGSVPTANSAQIELIDTIMFPTQEATK